MADGSIKAIQDVAVGEHVLATEPTTGETAGKPVTQLHLNLDTHLTYLTVVSGKGESSVIRTTWEHPFWSESRQAWVLAATLVTGETLLSVDGLTATIVAVENHLGSRPMHNLTIADFHTYYVLAGQTPVLVHNAPGPDPFGVPRVPGVYIIHLDNGEVYVGQGKNISERWRQHFGPKGTLTKAGFTRANIVGVDYRIPTQGQTLNHLEAQVFQEFGGKEKLRYNTNNPPHYKSNC